MNERDWKKFWNEIWLNDRIPFHQEEVEPLLIRHLPHLTGSRVLVPLCGKSWDMVWLKSQGYDVVGVELSPLACEQFFREQAGVEFEIINDGCLQIYRGGSFEIFCGDFFKLSCDQLGQISFIYDRAALIALSPSFQKKYADHLIDLMENNRSHDPILFLITFDFFEKPQRPPPYQVSEQDVLRLFGNRCSIQIISTQEDPVANSKNPLMQATYQKKLSLLRLS